MYGGEIMESGKASDVFQKPLHPYSIGLMQSIPSLDEQQDRLDVIKGEFSEVFELRSKGCSFASRCISADANCFETHPDMREITTGRFARCLKV
jgi:peptide/nickel transport system ATP-binding protein